MARYKNISSDALVIPQVGKFEPGEEFETDREILNPNIQLVATTPAPAPSAPAEKVAPVAEPATAAPAEGGSN